MRRFAVLAVAALAWIAAPQRASATWSIVAVDPQTQEVGVAVASCVEAPFGTTLLPQVPALAPGIGALAAQAQFSQQTRDAALDLLLAGTPPQTLVDMIVAGDPGAANRQYGVVDLRLAVATYTGKNAMDWAGHATGSGVTVQGNILYGPEVVDEALAAFEAPAPRCPWTLADRLMVALEAGSARGGDSRCSEQQSALAADLMVARPGDPLDALHLDLRIASQPDGGDNPVALLRVAYDQWRIANPPDDAACAGGSSSGASEADTTAGDEPGASTSAGEPGPATTGEADDEGGSLPPPGTSTDATGSTGAATADDRGSGGCGCDLAGQAPARGDAGFLLLVLLRIRPRRRETGDGSV